MDPKSRHPIQKLSAPGAHARTPAIRCPPPPPDTPWPSVEDHLVEPEVSRDEIVRGRRIHVMGAQPPHADRQAGLAYLLTAHARPGYVVSTELQTRSAFDSDFATDVCIRKEGNDPRTGVRYLEELSCEVVSTQKAADVSTKAEDLTLRGVRRVIGVFVKDGSVREWVGDWRILPPGSSIEDEVLARPLSVRAILDAAEADNAVAEALIAKKNPIIARAVEAGHEAGHEAGVADGLRMSLFALLLARGFPIEGGMRARIEACADLPTLSLWITRAATATTVGAIFLA